MKSLIKLQLMPEEATLETLSVLEGLKELSIDKEYGLVCISPKRKLYTIRVVGSVDPKHLMDIQPRVLGVYGDVRISAINAN